MPKSSTKVQLGHKKRNLNSRPNDTAEAVAPRVNVQAVKNEVPVDSIQRRKARVKPAPGDSLIWRKYPLL